MLGVKLGVAVYAGYATRTYDAKGARGGGGSETESVNGCDLLIVIYPRRIRPDVGQGASVVLIDALH